MKIWLINHYAVPPQYYPLARPSLFAKNLIKMGHEVTIIAASTIHNSNSKNLIEDNEKVRTIVDDGIKYVLINCISYQGNGINRIKNIWQFAKRFPKVLDTLEKPDAIVATSFDLFTCYEGIKYAKRHGIKAIAEIADLWPETLVSYKGVNPNNPIVKYLRRIEKKIYTLSDAIVFTMEGAYDYIKEQNWENVVPENKVHYINNGIDLEQFNYNKIHYQISDEDLRDNTIFKVVYTGAIRNANNLSLLVDAAKLIKNKDVMLLIWGDGDALDSLTKRIQEEHINNVIFKGRVPKSYIPFITSSADLNIVHGQESGIMRFGLSLNKMFDYLAAGKPILIDFHSPYNPVLDCGAGVESKDNTPAGIASAIESFATMDNDKKIKMCLAAKNGAKGFDFGVLTQRLIDTIESIH